MTDELFWKYMKCGGGEFLGDPRTPERVEQDGQSLVVRYRDFQRGSIYWTSETGISVIVEEKILECWRGKGRMLGYPTSDPIPGRGGVYNRFQHGTIYYFPYLDACEVHHDGRSSQDIWRRISIIAAAGLWLIVALIIGVSHSERDMTTGIFAVVSLLLSPLTALLINLLWKQPNTDDRS